MQKLFIASLLSLLISLPVHASADYDYFSKVLQLEMRWERLTTKTVGSYLAFLGKKGVYENLPPTTETQIKIEITAELEKRLSWDKLGEKFIASVMSACSDETLRNFAQVYKNKSIQAGRAAAPEYLSCASKGIKESFPLMQAEFKNAAPTLKRIAQKYR